MQATLILIVGMLLVPAAVAKGQPVECPRVSADTTGWTSYDEGAFTFKLPPGFEEADAYSLDSQVGRWEAGDANIYYDFGHYSNKLDPRVQGRFPGLAVCQMSAGSGTPRIVVFRHRETGEPNRIGAHWSSVFRDAYGDISLTVVGSVSGAYGFPEMLAVIRSVEFNSKHK